jgi:uncharacterized cysteine cluster protein YcgN (CxxCxxCC family)
MKKAHRRLHATGAVSQMIAAMSDAYLDDPCDACGKCSVVRYDNCIRCESCGHEEVAAQKQMH